MAENEIAPPFLGAAWDGTGFGLDGTIWGGEFLLVNEFSFTRFAHLRSFCLPGGEQAVKEPRRTALGLLYERFGDAAFTMKDLAPVRAFRPPELVVLRQALRQGINCPRTSSVGRLFDAVAGLIDLRQSIGFEGQAAMGLEFALEGFASDEAYPWRMVPGTLASPSGLEAPLILDWAALLDAILDDVRGQVKRGLISARFHNALAQAVVEIARRAGQSRVALSGGCFQNRYLTERTVQELQRAGFHPYWHQRVPPNDGGVALGQAVAAARTVTT